MISIEMRWDLLVFWEQSKHVSPHSFRRHYYYMRCFQQRRAMHYIFINFRYFSSFYLSFTLPPLTSTPPLLPSSPSATKIFSFVKLIQLYTCSLFKCQNFQLLCQPLTHFPIFLSFQKFAFYPTFSFSVITIKTIKIRVRKPWLLHHPKDQGLFFHSLWLLLREELNMSLDQNSHFPKQNHHQNQNQNQNTLLIPGGKLFLALCAKEGIEIQHEWKQEKKIKI